MGLEKFLLRGDDFDFHQRVLRQAGHFHSGAGRIAAFRKERGVNLVHGAEVVHITEEHGGLQHVVHVGARLGEDGFDVGQGLPGLCLDPLGESPGGGIDGQLPGGDDQSVVLNGLGVRADGGGRLARTDNSFHHDAPPFVFAI